MVSRQLQLVFADSPTGGGDAFDSGAPEGKAYLLHIAGARVRARTTTGTTTASRLLEEAMQPSNLAVALLHVARNRGAAGVDGRSVEDVVAESHRLLPRLRQEVLSERYRPGDVKRVWIPKPGGGQRGLGIPNVVDRWVQQAVHQVLEPVFDPVFHDSSHGFRPHRGAQTALAKAALHLREGRHWVVAVDLSKFFDRVNHQRLLARLGRRVEDGRVLRLIHRMLKANVVLPDGMRVAVEEGAPQGGPLSPILSNVVLDELDWEMDRRGLKFVRYADDFNVYVRSERAGQRVRQALTRFIEGRLRLKVNTDKSVVAPTDKVHFLGFFLKPPRDGKVEIHLSARSRERLAQRIVSLTPRNWGRSLDDCIAEANRYLNGWLGYFRLCTAEGAAGFHRYDAHLRRRLRAIAVRHQKRGWPLYRHLVSRGAPKRTAMRAAMRRCGNWKRSNLPGVTMAYRTVWFSTRLVCLTKEWSARAPTLPVSNQTSLF